MSKLYDVVGPKVKKNGQEMESKVAALAEALAAFQVEQETLRAQEQEYMQVIASPSAFTTEQLTVAYAGSAAVESKQQANTEDITRASDELAMKRNQLERWKNGFNNFVEQRLKIEAEIEYWKELLLWNAEILKGNKSFPKPRAAKATFTRALNDQISDLSWKLQETDK